MPDSLLKQSKINSRHQVTIPREVRERLKLGESAVIEWTSGEDGRIYVSASRAPIAEFRGAIKVGRGDTGRDLEEAREARVSRNR